ncbi:hypothetical protein BKA69DRAFT_1040075 [Paraphysoderma sedebokerense]|nr:hypothetical protein BKA69DRAFT_1040075 [Paraphysoderma sedebokerense]
MTFDDSAGPKQVRTAYFLISSFAGPILSICFRRLDNLRSGKKVILQTFPIHAGICTIGKSSTDIVLDDDAIADEHAMIQASDFGPHFIQVQNSNHIFLTREFKPLSMKKPIDSLVVSTNTTAVIQNNHHDVLHNQSLIDGSPSLLDDSIDSDIKGREDEAIDGTPFKIRSSIQQTADHSPECSLSIFRTRISTNQVRGPNGGVAVVRNSSVEDDTDTETVIDEAPAAPAEPRLSNSYESVVSTDTKACTKQSLSTSITEDSSDIAYHKGKRQENHISINDSNKNNEEQESFFVVGQTQTGADALLALSRNSSFFSAAEFTHDEESPPSDDQCTVVPEYSNFENTKPITVRTYRSRNSTSSRSTVNALDESVESENSAYKRSTKMEVQDETSSENDVRRIKEKPKNRGRPKKQKRQRNAKPIQLHDDILDISTHATDYDGLDASTCNNPTLKQDVGLMPKDELKPKMRRKGKKGLTKFERVSEEREILNGCTAHSVVDSGDLAEIERLKTAEIKKPTLAGEVAVRSGRKSIISALRKVETTDKSAFTENDQIQSSFISKIADSNLSIPVKESMRFHHQGRSAKQKSNKKEVSTAGKLSKRKAPSDTKESQSKKSRKAETNMQTEIKNSKSPFTIMLTGLNPEMTNSLIRHIQTLEGAVTDNYNRCNILVTDKVRLIRLIYLPYCLPAQGIDYLLTRRTVKFLSAISAGVDIVSVDWLTGSISAGSFLGL